jgi:hypothetical protein
MIKEVPRIGVLEMKVCKFAATEADIIVKDCLDASALFSTRKD